TEAQAALWRQFRHAIRLYLCVMIACQLALMVVLRVGYEPGHSVPIGFLVLPGALYFTLNRFDIVPALLVALSLLCLGRRRIAASAVVLAAATVLKLYPAFLCPLFVRYLSNERQTG